VEQAGGDRADEAEVPEGQVDRLPKPARGEETRPTSACFSCAWIRSAPVSRAADTRGAGEEQMEERIDVVAQGREPRPGTETAPERKAHHRHAVDFFGGRRAVVRGDHGHRVATRDEGAREKLEAPGGAAGSPRMVVLRGEDKLHFASQTAKKPGVLLGIAAGQPAPGLGEAAIERQGKPDHEIDGADERRVVDGRMQVHDAKAGPGQLRLQLQERVPRSCDRGPSRRRARRDRAGRFQDVPRLGTDRNMVPPGLSARRISVKSRSRW